MPDEKPHRNVKREEPYNSWRWRICYNFVRLGMKLQDGAMVQHYGDLLTNTTSWRES